ncbi:MAG: hypothetical protein PHX83_07425 [Acidobacteriia bacterium]|nr:hypothetical protein [Terriglobia bacterium]
MHTYFPMDAEKDLMDWLMWPCLILIVTTPLRFAMEAAGVSTGITRFFSSTVIVMLLSAYLGAAMAQHIENPWRRLIGAGFSLGYLNGLMTLIATLLSTYTTIETHYRYHDVHISDARHILMMHVVSGPLLISLVAILIALAAYGISVRIKKRRLSFAVSSDDRATSRTDPK